MILKMFVTHAVWLHGALQRNLHGSASFFCCSFSLFRACECLCRLLSGCCVHPSVHSPSPCLLPSVPLIPECVSNGRSRCSAPLRSAPRGLLFHVCVHVLLSLGGLGAVSEGAVQDPVLQKERGERYAGGTRLSQLALRHPLGPGPPLLFSPGTSAASLPLLSLSPSHFLS